MRSLIYIILKSAKNSLKELLRKPGKLILYLIVILAIIGFAVLSIFTEPNTENQAPLFAFTGILFAFITLFVIIAVIKGTSNGDNIFEMNDVNLLFVSPVSPRKILLYGILRLTKAAFWAGFFILFQSNSLANFGIGFDGVLLTLLTFMLDIVVLSIVSLILYNLTNGNPRRKLAVKLITCLIFVPLVVSLAVKLANTQNIFVALESAIQSPFMTFIPVAGWTAAGVTHLLSGELFEGLLFLSANLLLGAGLVVYLLLSKTDYYEDALVGTETAFEKKRAAAEGNIQAAQGTQGNIKVGKTGISGIGASAVFGKHLRESFRQNRFGFLTLPSVFIIAGAVVANLLVKDIIMILQILMWMQIFLIGTGRGLVETYSHYIYLIPESSFRKILWSNMEVIVKTLMESVLIFGIAGAVTGANGLVMMGAVIAYTLFSLLLLGINYLSMRFTGANIGMGLLIMIYYLAVIVSMVPGVAAAIIVGNSIGGSLGAFIGLCILSAWELATGLVCFALSQGVLHHCDMPTGKPKS